MKKKTPVPINVEHVDMKKLKTLSGDFPALMKYAHTAGGFAITPTKEGAIKGKALSAMKQQSQMQLDMLFEQVQLLAKQVQSIKERAAISELIYEASIGITPIIGEHYYLYQKEHAQLLSLVSPEEWGESNKSYEFMAEVQLLADHTWKIIRRGNVHF